MLMGWAILSASNNPGQDTVWLNFHSREVIHALECQTLGTYMTLQTILTSHYAY